MYKQKLYSVYCRMGVDSDCYVMKNNLTYHDAVLYASHQRKFWRIVEIKDAL